MRPNEKRFSKLLTLTALLCGVLILCGGCWGGGLFQRRQNSSTAHEEVAEQQSRNTSTEPRIYPLPYAVVFEQSRRTLSDLNWQVVASDESAGRQEAFPSLHFFSWGSKIRITIEDLGGNRTRVAVVYGDNRGSDGEKVALFLGRLDARVGSVHAEHTAPPPVTIQRSTTSAAAQLVSPAATPPASQATDITARNAAFDEGKSFFAEGKYAQAAESFNRAFRLDPAFADAIYNAGTAYYYAGDFASAETAYNFFIQQRPHDAEGYYYRGVCRYKQSDVEGAVADWKRVLEINASHSAARANLQALGRL